MKKSLLTLLGAGLLLTSCQSDEPFAPVEGGEKQVTFTLTAPDAVGTRANGAAGSDQGGIANNPGETIYYSLELYYQGVKQGETMKTTATGKQVTFSPTVILGRNYEVVAYANLKSEQNDLKNITVATGINDEKNDAYFATVPVQFTENDLSEEITLKRPFGKLRLVATDYDASKTAITNIEVTYAAAHQNLFDAQATAGTNVYGVFSSNNTTVKYTATHNPAYYADATGKTIFVDYIAAPAENETLVKFNIKVDYATGGESFTRTFTQDIPVRRNALTTLSGNFFTANSKITVKVDENFDDSKAENRTLVSSASQLQEVINSATPGETTEIILGNDIELTGSLVFGASPSVNPAPAQTRSEEATAGNYVLDLNGKTIEGTMPKSVGHVIEIRPGATLKVIGGKISSTAANGGSAIYNAGTLEVDGTTIVGASVRENGGWPSYPVNNYSNMTLKNVIITGYQGAIACNSAGTTTLDNCTINKEYLNTSSHVFYIDHADANVVVNSGTYTHKGMDGSLAYVIKGSITVNGGTFSASNGGYGMAALANGSITVNGGTFETKFEDWGGKITLTGGEFAAKPADKYIAAGYKALINQQGDKYYVVPTTEAEVVATTTADLNEALANGSKVVLFNDIAVAKSEVGSNGYGATGISQLNGGLIDGNGKKLSVNAWSTWDSALNTTGGTIKNLNVTGGMRGIFVNHNSTNNSKVILDNVVIDGTIYTISCDQGTNQGLEATNSTFNGWTSYASTIGEVKFTNCSFGEGQGYAFCRPYAPTTFVGCNFAAGFELDAVAAVTFENCKINGVALTAENLATLVTSNTANATVK